MPEIVKRVDVVTHAKSRLIDQWRGDPTIVAILEAIAEEIQLLEDDLWAVISSRGIDDRGTHDLDVLGKVLQRGRRFKGGSLSDARYRVALKIWILALRSHGRWKDLSAILATVPRPSFVLYEATEALWIDLGFENELDGETIFATLNRARKAGVALVLSFLCTTDEKAFRFSFSVSNEADDDDTGFSWSGDPNVDGGIFPGVLSNCGSV